MAEYDVFRVDDENTRMDRIGRVTVDDQGRMGLVDSSDDELSEAIEELNSEESLMWKHPGDRENAAGRTVVAKDDVPRGSPDFLKALQDNLQRWYAMELDIAVPDEPEEPDEAE